MRHHTALACKTSLAIDVKQLDNQAVALVRAQRTLEQRDTAPEPDHTSLDQLKL